MKSFLSGLVSALTLAVFIIWLLPTDQPPGEQQTIDLEFPTQSETGEVKQPEQAQLTEAEQQPEAEIIAVHQIRSGDTLLAIFNKIGISESTYHKLTQADRKQRSLSRLRPGQMLYFEYTAERKLSKLTHERDAINSIVYTIAEGAISVEKEAKNIETRTETAHGKIQSSLFADGTRAGMSSKLIIEMARLFNWDIDFGRELQPGDYFGVIFEGEYVDGKRIGTGDILAAEFINGKKKHRVIRYEQQGGVDYLDEKGRSRKKQFIRTPLNFSRISSKFTNKRWHPVLKRWRSHKGVDYAAPTGTPVWSTADGVVQTIGRQTGYGKVIYLKHGNKYTTVYGHLSGFKKNLKKGDRVKQNEIIGYVGQTGLATGPHLHYEFRINNAHVNPLSHKLPVADPLSKSRLRKFTAYADPLLKTLDLLKGNVSASQNEEVALNQ